MWCDESETADVTQSVFQAENELLEQDSLHDGEKYMKPVLCWRCGKYCLILFLFFLTSSEVYFTESPPLVATAGVTSVLSLCSVATPVPLYAFTVPFPSGV